MEQLSLDLGPEHRVLCKVRIGSRYNPTSYEMRGNNGYYQAFRPTLTSSEEQVQRMLLERGTVTRDWAGYVAWTLFVGFLYVVATVGSEVL